MLRRLVIIVLSLLAIVSGLYWIDIYRPRTTTAELEANVARLKKKLDVAYRTDSELWAKLGSGREIVRINSDVRKLRDELSDARAALRNAQEKSNSLHSQRVVTIGGVGAGIAKCSRLASGHASAGLRAVAWASYTVAADWVPSSARSMDAMFGDYGFFRGLYPQLKGPPVWIHFRLSVPLWALTLLFAAYPVSALIRGPIRRRRRWIRGLCIACGYNLTGLPTATCPECGMAGQGRSLKDSNTHD